MRQPPVGNPVFNLALELTDVYGSNAWLFRGTRYEQLMRMTDKMRTKAETFAGQRLLGPRHVTDEGYLLPQHIDGLATVPTTLAFGPQYILLLNLEDQLKDPARREDIDRRERLQLDPTAVVMHAQMRYRSGQSTHLLVKDGRIFLDAFPAEYERMRRTPFAPPRDTDDLPPLAERRGGR